MTRASWLGDSVRERSDATSAPVAEQLGRLRARLRWSVPAVRPKVLACSAEAAPSARCPSSMLTSRRSPSPRTTTSERSPPGPRSSPYPPWGAHEPGPSSNRRASDIQHRRRSITTDPPNPYAVTLRGSRRARRTATVKQRFRVANRGRPRSRVRQAAALDRDTCGSVQVAPATRPALSAGGQVQQSHPGRQPHTSASAYAAWAAVVAGTAQQPLLCQASRPSVTATAAMTRAAIGSAQDQPRGVLRSRPTRSTAYRQVHSGVCLESATAEADPSSRPARR